MPSTMVQDGSFPEGFTFRLLEEDDFGRGYMECLSELTVVGEVNYEIFQDRLTYMKQRGDCFFPHVLVDAEGRIAAAGTLFIERKFIRNCGSVGHVEDIVVCGKYRGRNFGRLLLQKLIDLARDKECYKIILDCEAGKVQFYEKCGFAEKGRQMALYFDK